MQMKGIDVSSWQGDIDFQQVKNSGINFVIIKAGEWDFTDPNFEKNYEAAKAAGLYIGFYWFCDGETLDEISMEAESCIEALEGKQFDFPIFMDMEKGYQFNLGREFCSNAVREFCGKLEKAGYFAGLYVSASWLDDTFGVIYKDVREKYAIWVADWRGYCGYDGDYGMWQYGAGYVPGINAKTDFNILDIGYDTDYPGSVVEDGVDLDYAYADYPSLIISNGLNNYPKPETEDTSCREVANVLSIKGAVPILSGDKWFLIDESCKFTLKTLPFAKVNIYLVGGGQDGAEWFRSSENGQEVYNIAKMSRGGCVFKKEIYITGNVECQAVIAEPNNLTGTSLKIGSDVYKCTDPGYVHRKATASSNAWQTKSGVFNAENGANGMKTPYGYVGSSGGGGGGYSEHNYQRYVVYAGKGGAGAGDGGEVKCDGADAVNYGCGGGAAGFAGFLSEGDAVETHSGSGMGGCVIFEILNGGACEDPGQNNGCSCGCVVSEFTCSEPTESVSESVVESDFRLTYDGENPVITESSSTSENGSVDDSGELGGSENDESSGGLTGSADSVSSGKSGCNGRSGGNNCRCGSHSHSNGCSCGGGKSKCVSYDVQRWGENWLLFDESGEYSLNFDEDAVLTAYLVGGGSDGQNGIYYNKTAYGGDGGRGGCVNVIGGIEVFKGTLDIIVNIGGRGEYGTTSLVVGESEYCCNGLGNSIKSGGFQGISGRHGFRNAGNGANGIETPFGWIGSSGGGGAAYCNGSTSGRGRGGLDAGNGGKIVNGKSSPGENASGYGCGGGGGAASPTSWCKGGRGKHGCVILRIDIQE